MKEKFLPNSKIEWFLLSISVLALIAVVMIIYGFFIVFGLVPVWSEMFSIVISSVFGFFGVAGFVLTRRYQKKNEKDNDVFRREAGFYYILTAELVNPLIRIRRYQTYLEDDTNTLVKENCEEIKKYLQFILNATKACDKEYVNSLNVRGKPLTSQAIIVTANLLSDYYLWRQEQNLTWRINDFGKWFINKFDGLTKEGFIIINVVVQLSKMADVKNNLCSIKGNGDKDFYSVDFEEYMEQIFQNLNSPSTFYLVPSMMSFSPLKSE